MPLDPAKFMFSFRCDDVSIYHWT